MIDDEPEYGPWEWGFEEGYVSGLQTARDLAADAGHVGLTLYIDELIDEQTGDA